MAKRLFLLFSHMLREEQEESAKDLFGVEKFVTLPSELQGLWSSVPPELESILGYLEPIREYLQEELREGDVVLIQGDFGATYHMVHFVDGLGARAIYATTKRDVIEELNGDVVVKRSVFKHVRFRAYV